MDGWVWFEGDFDEPLHQVAPHLYDLYPGWLDDLRRNPGGGWHFLADLPEVIIVCSDARLVLGYKKPS